MNVKLFDIEVEVMPSGPCALLIPHADSEEGLTLQQSLDKLPKHQLALFAAVQAVEWAASESPVDGALLKTGPAQTAKERLDAIHARHQRAMQESLWREVFVEARTRRGQCRKATS